MNCYIFDLDLTIADGRHRDHLRPKGWEAYNRECTRDIPMEYTINILKALYDSGFKIIIVTARGEACRTETVFWLSKHNVPYHELHMRPLDDARMAHMLKLDLFNKISETHNVVGAFDDNLSVIETLSANGYNMIAIPASNFGTMIKSQVT